jgi:hypothetical protein
MMSHGRWLGHVLLWTGFLVATLAAVSRGDRSSTGPEKWQAVAWTWYLVGIASSTAGVVVLRVTQRALRRVRAVGEARQARLWELTEALSAGVDSLWALVEEGQVFEVRHAIDARLVEPLAEFAAQRHVLVEGYGITVFASVMSVFAQLERNLNRAWCASADGYVDELRRSLEAARQAATALRDAVRALRVAAG